MEIGRVQLSTVYLTVLGPSIAEGMANISDIE